jgi:hypothetical protein
MGQPAARRGAASAVTAIASLADEATVNAPMSPSCGARRCRRGMAGAVARRAAVRGAALSAMVMSSWVAAVPAGAQIPNPAPDSSMPGAELVTQVLGWLKWGGLVAGLAAMLIGAIATGVGHFGSNYSASSAGRKWVLGGMGSAILAGLAWTITNTLYTATGG